MAGGTYAYQLADHLGNVRAVVVKSGTSVLAVTNRTDYYPGGMAMPERSIVGDYRYDYQGQEKDRETGHNAFELKMYDPRINRWLTTDPKKEFASPYLAMGNNWVNRIDPDGGSTDDWVSKDGKNFYWDESINNSNQATAKGLIYGGATKPEVIQGFGRTGFLGYFFGHGLEFNDNSYNNAKFSIVSKNAIIAEKNRNTKPLTKQQIQKNESLWPDDRYEPSRSSYKVDIDFLKTAFHDQDFLFSMDINGETIFANAAFSKTNKNIQYISNVLEGKNVSQGVFTGHSNTSFILGNSNKTSVIIINFKSQEDYHKIRNFTFGNN